MPPGTLVRTWALAETLGNPLDVVVIVAISALLGDAPAGIDTRAKKFLLWPAARGMELIVYSISMRAKAAMFVSRLSVPGSAAALLRIFCSINRFN
jgi:hypothetical protein